MQNGIHHISNKYKRIKGRGNVEGEELHRSAIHYSTVQYNWDIQNFHLFLFTAVASAVPILYSVHCTVYT